MNVTNIAPNSTTTTVMVQFMLLALAMLLLRWGWRVSARRPDTVALPRWAAAVLLVAAGVYVCASIVVYALDQRVYALALLAMALSLWGKPRGEMLAPLQRWIFLLALAMIGFQAWRMTCPLYTAECLR